MKGDFNIICFLRRGDVAFIRNNEQLGEGRRQDADKVEVRSVKGGNREVGGRSSEDKEGVGSGRGRGRSGAVG